MMTPRYDHLKSIFVSLIQLFLMIPQSGDSIFGHPPQCLQDLRPFVSPLPIHQEKFEAAVLALSAHCSPSLEKRMSLITVVLDCLQFNVEQDDRLRRAGYSPIILSLHQPRKLDNNGEVRSDQQHAPDQLQDAVEENETSTDPASCIPPSEICNWPIIATITTDGRLNMEENMVASVRNCYQQYSQLLRSQGVKTLSVNGAQVHVDLLFHDGHELEELRGRRNVAIHQIDSLINNSGGERRAILMDRKVGVFLTVSLLPYFSPQRAYSCRFWQRRIELRNHFTKWRLVVFRKRRPSLPAIKVCSRIAAHTSPFTSLNVK